MISTGTAGSGDIAVVLDGWRALVERRLETLFTGAEGRLAGFAEAVRYSLLAPGKRIRPLLVLAAADACGADVDDAVDVACALELVHAYSLVHDDLPCMDDDDLRRGRPTSHKVYGEDVAVLVGDALQGEAFALVVGASRVAPEARLQAIGVLARAGGWTGMVGGQYLDMHEAREPGDETEIRDVHDRKTGALIAASVEVGGIVAGVEPGMRDGLAAFGRELGWLFQLVDDLLDEVGDVSLTGKAVGSDRRHDKATAVGVYGLDGLQAAADAQLVRCLEHASALPDGGGILADIARYVRVRDR